MIFLIYFDNASPPHPIPSQDAPPEPQATKRRGDLAEFGRLEVSRSGESPGSYLLRNVAFPWHFTYWGTTVVESSDFYFEITR